MLQRMGARLRLPFARARRSLGKHGIRWALGLALTMLAAAHVLSYLHSETLDRFDQFLSGLQLRLDPVEKDPRIVIVDIDGKALSEVGRFPWSRNVHAKLIDQLFDRYHVSVVGYDIDFPEPDTSSGYGVLEKLAKTELADLPEVGERVSALRGALDFDGQFASALQGRPVVLGFTPSIDQHKGVLPKPLFTEQDLNGRELDAFHAPGFEANIAKLQRTAAGAGSFAVSTDDDGLVRTVFLIQKVGEGYYPSLALATIAQHLKIRAIKPVFTETVDTLSDSQRAAGGVDAIQLLQSMAKRYKVPVGEGMTTVIQYRGRGGPQGGAFNYVSAADVLAGRVPAATLKDTIVLIGTTAPGLVDLRATPVNPQYPGVEIHANIIKSILEGRFKHRGQNATTIETAVVLAVGIALTLALGVVGPLASVGIGVCAMAGLAMLGQYAYTRHDLVYNGATPLLLVLALFVVNAVLGYLTTHRKNQGLVNRFGEYVAPELVAEMAEDPDAYNMDGESRELTVMFVDVRGFTTISEGLSPKDLREYINLYLTAMSEDIRSAHRGTLDKYIGDAVMAFWGAPVHQPDHASRAVATALLMQASATKLNEDFLKRGWPELKIGIGLNTGMMHVGDMGSAIRKAYTVMGDAVNLGSRLEGITKVYGVGVCVGAATRAAAPEFIYRELDLVRVKGKNEPVAIYEPLGKAGEVDGATLAAVNRWHEALAHVRAQRWDDAHAILTELQAVDPGFGLYQLYLDRIEWFRAHTPGEGWDGVTTFETK
nr:adenylate/guanylate cyclase domain-containing protein [Massilia arenosa]